MIASKNIDHTLYLGSIYYYLHFQYNGWFFFGSMALLVNMIPATLSSFKKHFYILVCTAIFTFFLSILWSKLPDWLYVLTVVATLLQMIAWISLATRLLKSFRQVSGNERPKWVTIFFTGAILAITIKFILQTISVIPSLSQLVFGFRPIVIAYLHLVLLGVYSLFLIGWLGEQRLISLGRPGKFAALFSCPLYC